MGNRIGRGALAGATGPGTRLAGPLTDTTPTLRTPAASAEQCRSRPQISWGRSVNAREYLDAALTYARAGYPAFRCAVPVTHAAGRGCSCRRQEQCEQPG
jgi:hypothetical protein